MNRNHSKNSENGNVITINYFNENLISRLFLLINYDTQYS